MHNWNDRFGSLRRSIVWPLTAALVLLAAAGPAMANHIRVRNAGLTAHNPAGKTADVIFDLAWDHIRRGCRIGFMRSAGKRAGDRAPTSNGVVAASARRRRVAAGVIH